MINDANNLLSKAAISVLITESFNDSINELFTTPSPSEDKALLTSLSFTIDLESNNSCIDSISEETPPSKEINAIETSERTSSFSESSRATNALFLRSNICSSLSMPFSAGIKCQIINALKGYAKARESSAAIFSAKPFTSAVRVSTDNISSVYLIESN